MNNIGFHIVIDNIPNGELDNLLNFFIQYKPSYLNVKGGERFERAMQFVERLYIHCPETKVILRRWPDDGILRHYNYDVQLWYNDIIKPIEGWLLKHTNVIWMLDNESMSNDLSKYALATRQAMELLGSKGIGLAVGRFATGNPKTDQYHQLKPMFEGLKKWFSLHIWSPNEYFEKPNATSGSGSIFRYYNGWQYCKDNLGFIPETVIGEFGLAVNYDPQKGFRKVNLDETQYAKICTDYFSKWYAPYDVPVLIYCIGDWHGFEVSQTFLNYVYNKPVNVNVIEKPGVITDIPNIPEQKLYAVCFENNVRIRQTPVNGKTLAYVHKFSSLLVLDNGVNIGKQDQWIKVLFDGQEAYTAAWFYVPCGNPVFLKNQLKIEDNMTVNSVLEFLRTFLTRPVLAAILGPVIAILLSYVPDFPFTDAQILEVMVTLVLFIIGANTVWEGVNAAKGNIWNRQTKQFIKPYEPETDNVNTITNIIE